ncbi:MAG: LacI family DNA-binding transcriptional regulator [Shimia sp.]|jgi:LacI family transcriptional regulator|uniref:LacI family DNA-binding transcriptional regulator n=1 Tax=Shimia sp. TaxID=1954381 RepID=UPI0025D54157|nr:LacI family DNA-binding transcriptional regulator [Shimia sp.]MCH2069642.1 LacI family DNA-binding transcriptional regulator [Shimia sp.]
MTNSTKNNGVPTLADVAQHANVSTATVSRCLNSPERVGEKTRKRVMKAVRELGYAPNFGAQALAARQTNTIAAVIPTMENAVFARGLQAFQEELGRHGKTLLVASSAYDAELEEQQVRALVARGADGLLLIGYDRAPDIYAFLAKQQVPTLIAWSFKPEEKRPTVGFDNRAAMTELARQVIAQGHQHIACISAPTASNDRARERVDGIRDAISQAGQNPADLVVVETPYGIETGERAFRQVMTEAPQTTAVMCVNDVLAVGALRAVREMGMKVPDDLSLTGFDDIEIATLAEPPLTTVHVPHREMGRCAADMLLQILRGDQNGHTLELATEIRIRQSLGPAPD